MQNLKTPEPRDTKINKGGADLLRRLPLHQDQATADTAAALTCPDSTIPV